MVERQIELLKSRQRVEESAGQRAERVAFNFIRQFRLCPALGTRTEEQTAQPAELAQCRQQLAIERGEPQAAKIEFFRLGGVACRDPT